MFHKQITSPGEARPAMMRLLTCKGALRDLATKSGISTMTLRRIAATGRADSYVTALAIERATDGTIKADAIAGPNTKGFSFYQDKRARALLDLAFDEDVSLARLLARHGLTGTDLWVFIKTPDGNNERTKEKVRTMLRKLGLSDQSEAA